MYVTLICMVVKLYNEVWYISVEVVAYFSVTFNISIYMLRYGWQWQIRYIHSLQQDMAYTFVIYCCPWWRHQMESLPVTDPLCGEFIGHRWIPPRKGQWRGVLMFSLICAWINGWVNNRQAGDLRRHHAHYDVNVMHSSDVSLSSVTYTHAFTIYIYSYCHCYSFWYSLLFLLSLLLS